MTTIRARRPEGMLPGFLTRSDQGLTPRINEEAMMRAIQGGVPAEVEAYAPPARRSSDYGEAEPYSSKVRALLEDINRQSEEAAAAHDRCAAEIRQAAKDACEAILVQVIDAATQWRDSTVRAESVRELYADLVTRGRELVVAKQQAAIQTKAEEPPDAEAAAT